MSTTVKTYKCPEIAFKYDKNPNQVSFNKSPKSFTNKEDSINLTNSQLARKEVREFLSSSIKKLASTKSEGLEKLHHKNDILTKLGVPAPKEQTMPLKMKLGIIEGRKKRAEKLKTHA